MINYKEILQNIKNNTITEDMILLACYSVNKRSKYYRDLLFFRHDEKIEDKKEEMYRLKVFFLQYFTPICIHKEIHYKEKLIKINDKLTETQQENVLSKLFSDSNFIRYFTKNDKQFVVMKTDKIDFYKYYLYYDKNDYHFHEPILADDVTKFNLPIITLDKMIVSNPVQLNELLPLSLIYKIYDILQNKKVNL